MMEIVEPWHSLNSKKVFEKLHTSENGLKNSQIPYRLKKYGVNEIKGKGGKNVLVMLFEQFANLMIIILLLAATVSFLMHEWIDATMIVIIVILNAFMGLFQEYKAEKSIEALKKMINPKAVVFREGREEEILAKKLVPGDIVLLETGVRVPADVRLIKSTNLKVDESMLTGESTPVEKRADKILDRETPISERFNCCFMSSVVTYGSGLGVVVNTGMNAEIGRIAKMVQESKPEKTPLEKRLDNLSLKLAGIIILITLIIFVLDFLEGHSLLQSFLIAVSLAVSAIPEGLPAVVTLTLALGVQRMAKKKAIVRKLSAVQTLGSTTVICTDKTGTLTQNQMTVQKIFLGKEVVNVSGVGFAPEGRFSVDKKTKDLQLLLKAGALCNNAYLSNENNEWNIIGDPTEGSLLTLSLKGGLDATVLKKKFPRFGEVSFDSKRKMMSVIVEEGEDMVVYTKGAPDILLKKCDKVMVNGRQVKLTNKRKKEILLVNEEFGNSALRVLALAYKKVKKKGEYDESVEKNLVFIGLAGMMDPPREEVTEAIAQCKEAGVKVVMVTGDHRITATAIAKKIGLFSEGSLVVDGSQIDGMTDEDFEKMIENIAVFARVSPEHKVRIVETFKKKDHVIAMTGDGVNDAPALKKADIGIAMGVTGTDVAKEASDMILLDDNFATIVKSIKEGRTIFDNIKKFIRYMLSANFDELALIATAALLRFPLPMIPIQILWNNLVSDGLPALALGVDPPERGVMKKPPEKPKAKIINKLLPFSIFAGLIAFIFSLALFVYALTTYGLVIAQTTVFAFTLMFEMFLVFSAKTEKRLGVKDFFNNKMLLLAVTSSIILELVVIYTPVLQPFFGTAALPAMDWLMICVAGLTGVLLVEGFKPVLNKITSKF